MDITLQEKKIPCIEKAYYLDEQLLRYKAYEIVVDKETADRFGIEDEFKEDGSSKKPTVLVMVPKEETSIAGIKNGHITYQSNPVRYKISQRSDDGMVFKEIRKSDIRYEALAEAVKEAYARDMPSFEPLFASKRTELEIPTFIGDRVKVIVREPEEAEEEYTKE